MTGKSLYLRAFNELFFEFLNKAATFVPSPQNEDILLSIHSSAMIKKANPTIIIKAWYQQITLKYATQIANEDFDFFTEKDYSEDLTQFSQTDKIFQMINNLRNSLKAISSEEKLQLVVFVKQLSALSFQYN
jgi:hypothetical protein